MRYHIIVPMGKHDATFDQIQRLNAGLHWKKVESLLRSLGAELYEGAGSTITFVLDGRKLTVDRPHPRKECGLGLIKRIRRFLSELGYL
jgi:predicted RNA binding protein YcfA (HicA-like mRNA interferase family)